MMSAFKEKTMSGKALGKGDPPPSLWFSLASGWGLFNLSWPLYGGLNGSPAKVLHLVEFLVCSLSKVRELQPSGWLILSSPWLSLTLRCSHLQAHPLSNPWLRLLIFPAAAIKPPHSLSHWSTLQQLFLMSCRNIHKSHIIGLISGSTPI